MKKFIPLILVLILLTGVGYFVLNDNPPHPEKKDYKVAKLDEFTKSKSCARIPTFLYKMGIKRPIIDLSQQRYKGIAFYYGTKFNRVLHKKEWERYDALGTYTIDKGYNVKPNLTLLKQPNTIGIFEKSLHIPQLTKSYDGTTYLRTYDSLVRPGRAIQRKFVLPYNDTTLNAPISTELFVTNY